MPRLRNLFRETFFSKLSGINAGDAAEAMRCSRNVLSSVGKAPAFLAVEYDKERR